MFRAMNEAWLRKVGRGIGNPSGFSACVSEQGDQESGNEKSEHARFAGLRKSVGPDSSEEILTVHAKLVRDNFKTAIPLPARTATAEPGSEHFLHIPHVTVLRLRILFVSTQSDHERKPRIPRAFLSLLQTTLSATLR
jgi:hypothetical protein